MDLIQYLSQRKDKEGKLIKKKKKGKKERIPRRGRGFGQRHRVYREKKSKENDIDTKILALLTTLLKQNKQAVDLSNPDALNPFVEKDRQKYSMKFDSGKQKKDILTEPTEEEKKGIRKQLTMGDEGDISSFIEGVESSYQDAEQKQIELATITNKLADYESKWTDIVETQESLKQELDDIPVGNVRDTAQENFRLQNLEVKENVFSLQQQLQDDLNQAVDLNDYKDFIDFQKKVLGVSVDNFVAVDDRLAQELKAGKKKLGEEIKGFTQLQEETFQEKLEIKKANELLNVELEKSQQKEMKMMDELNTITGEYTKLKEKVYQMETNPPAKSPPRVEVEEIELPKPKPTEEELKARKEKKEALRIGREQLARKKKEEEERKIELTKFLTDWVKSTRSYAGNTQKKVVELFGEEENEKLIALGGQDAYTLKKQAVRQLLQEKRGVEF